MIVSVRYRLGIDIICVLIDLPNAVLPLLLKVEWFREVLR